MRSEDNQVDRPHRHYGFTFGIGKDTVTVQVAINGLGFQVMEQDIRYQEKRRKAKGENIDPFVDSYLMMQDKIKRRQKQHAARAVQHGIQFWKILHEGWN